MRFNVWLTKFCMAIDNRSVFTMNELKEAWENGKDAKEVAKANDALAAEYAELDLEIAA